MAGRVDPLAVLRQRPEREIVRAILAALRSVPGVVAWRNNTGAVTVPAHGARQRRFVRFGEPGMSDIIGWKTWRPSRDVLVRPQLAVFLALEVKRPGASATQAQVEFLRRVRAGGGIAAVVTSVDDALAAVRGG